MSSRNPLTLIEQRLKLGIKLEKAICLVEMDVPDVDNNMWTEICAFKEQQIKWMLLHTEHSKIASLLDTLRLAYGDAVDRVWSPTGRLFRSIMLAIFVPRELRIALKIVMSNSSTASDAARFWRALDKTPFVTAMLKATCHIHE